MDRLLGLAYAPALVAWGIWQRLTHRNESEAEYRQRVAPHLNLSRYTGPRKASDD